MFKIMIVEDDEGIAQGMREILTRWGYEARIVRDFSRVAEETFAFQAQLVLLDVSLPLFNGFYWCKKIRETSKLPIIFVSSRGESMDVVMAINMGGDDYIVKPFAPEVLVAKTQALLRRAYDFEPEKERAIRGVRYSEKTGCLLPGDRQVQLTRNESRILSLLLDAKGEVVSRETIMLALWDSDEFVDDNTLTVNMNRLRKTLSEAGLSDVIVTHKGQGYRLDA